MKPRRRRQLLLFLASLVVPSLAVVAFGLGMIAQERVRSSDRAARERSQTVAKIGSDVLARLERIKTAEISAHPDIDAPPPALSDPAVVFVGWEEQGRLVLPWDRDLASARFRDDVAEPEFARKIEVAESDTIQVVAIYDSALKDARNPSQSAHAQLLLARALERRGLREAAARHYRELLTLPSSVVDDQGVPFAFWAAERLSRGGPDSADIVVGRLGAEIASPGSMSPVQAYFLRGIVQKLPKLERGADDRLLRHVAALEQSIRLQHEFESLRVTPNSWAPYGAEPWLVGVSPSRPGNRRLVVAVRGPDLFKAVEQQHAGSVPGLRILAGSSSVDSLGDSLPGLRASFASVQGTDRRGLGLQSFYIVSLVLVVGLTLVGGYLVWRDTRREIRMADLRSQFVSNVSHELKTPLTSIRMFAEALQMKGLADERKQVEYLDTIVNESERLTRLLNNVLDFSRIERGQKNYQMAPASLAAIMDDAARTMKYPLARLGFDLRLDVCGDIPPVPVDRDAVEQAILNLLTNAMKYSGGSREIGLRLVRQNGSAVIQVSDQGVGIPVVEQSRIFEKFYRVPGPENDAIAGTGLGLALVSHTAAAHGGTVSVESSPGRGSTFSLSLPLEAVSGSSTS